MIRSRFAPVLSILALAACADAPSEPQLGDVTAVDAQLASVGAESRVTGHWEITFAGGYQGNYSSNAIVHADGSVSGEWQLQELGPDGTRYTVHGDVVCVTILPDGRTARVGGIIERASSPLPEGYTAAVWTVRDNGEGRGATDFASDIRYGYPTGDEQFFCDQGFNLGVFQPVERGNIQVRP
ncbi:MAG TPA: hypothetical protein VF039_02655 [Longimicrobiales bacterium]